MDRIRGSWVDGTYTGTASQILAKGGMAIKFMVVTGSSDEFEEEHLGGKNLGVAYNIWRDEIILTILPSYYSTKKHYSDVAKEIVHLTRQDIQDISSSHRVLSRRNALSMVMGVYDPLGLASAALVKGKIML